MRKLRRPSPALVIAFVALFIAAGGGAWAAGGGPDKPSAHAKASASGPRGPRGPRGFRGFRGFTGPQGPRGVTGPVGPSDGFVKRVAARTSLPSMTDAPEGTTVVQLLLPTSNSGSSGYIVTAATELGTDSGTAGL